MFFLQLTVLSPCSLCVACRRCDTDEFGIPTDPQYLMEKHLSISTNQRVIAMQLAEELAAHQPHMGGTSAIAAKQTTASMIKGFNAAKVERRQSGAGMMQKSKSSAAILPAQSPGGASQPATGQAGASVASSQAQSHQTQESSIAAEEKACEHMDRGDPQLVAATHWKYESDDPFCW